MEIRILDNNAVEVSSATSKEGVKLLQQYNAFRIVNNNTTNAFAIWLVREQAEAHISERRKGFYTCYQLPIGLLIALIEKQAEQSLFEAIEGIDQQIRNGKVRDFYLTPSTIFSGPREITMDIFGGDWEKWV